jgi:hypothetical protein
MKVETLLGGPVAGDTVHTHLSSRLRGRRVFSGQRVLPGRRIWLGLISCFSGLMLVGCNPPPRPEFGELSRTTIREDLLADQPEELPDLTPAPKPFTEPWETWQSYHIGGKHIGYSHVRAEPASDEIDSPIKITLEDQITLHRGPASIVQRLEQTSLETRNGDVISFEAELRIGPALTKFSGSVDSELLTIVTTRGSKQTSQTIAWEERYRGLVGLQQSLMSDPLDVGDQRRLRTLVPIQFAVATVEMNCQHTASIAMPDGTTREGREVEVAIRIGDTNQPLETMVWIDEHGKVLKSYTPALDLVAYDSTAEAATENIVAAENILSATSLAVTGKPLTDPTQAMRVGYTIVPRPGQQDRPSAAVFQPQPGQWSRQTAEGAFQLLVSRDPDEPTRGGFEADQSLPEPEDSRPGPLINSNDPLVKKLADTSGAKKDQPLRLALDLTQTVKTLIRRHDYSQGFRPASEVARDGSGDSTAHSILLAAMLRSRGIPARVAVGLVYVPSQDQPRMAFHMWTIAHIENRWVHLDATLTGGYAAADRITLGTYHLADGNEYECVAPVVAAIGRYDVQILNATYRPLQ